MHCMLFGRFGGLKEKEGKREREERQKKKGCHIRADPVMQIAQKSLPVLAAWMLGLHLFDM